MQGEGRFAHMGDELQLYRTKHQEECPRETELVLCLFYAVSTVLPIFFYTGRALILPFIPVLLLHSFLNSPLAVTFTSSWLNLFLSPKLCTEEMFPHIPLYTSLA